MSGATILDASAVASARVRVDAEPNPPRMPAAAGRAARGDDEQVGAERVDLRADLRLGALAETDGQDDGGDPDQDAEHRQRRPQPVGGPLEPGPEGLEPAHRTALRGSARRSR